MHQPEKVCNARQSATKRLSGAGVVASVGTYRGLLRHSIILGAGWQIVGVTRATTGSRAFGSDPAYDWRPRLADALTCRPIGLPSTPADHPLGVVTR